MKEYIIDQFYHLNFLTIIIVISVTTMLAKSNTNKEIKELTAKIYMEVEEIKDEIRTFYKKE